MSRLRVSNRPGGWLDEGPQVVPAHRGQHLSGSLVVGYTPRPVVLEATTPSRRAQMAEYRARTVEQCGKKLVSAKRMDDVCARKAGHKYFCSSRYAMEREQAARMARRVAA